MNFLSLLIFIQIYILGKVICSPAKKEILLKQQNIVPKILINRKINMVSTEESDSKIVAESSVSIRKNIEIAVYLGLWYLISGYYNVYNKQALNLLKLPWFVATVQVISNLITVILQ